jgi:broad specificity phosphatase PhoE
MYKRVVFAVALVTFLAAPAIAAAQKLVLVTRHAERTDEPARNEPDPQLSAAGQARAEKLNAMLKDAGVAAIYVTQYRRTRETAGPLASTLKLTPQMTPANIEELISTLKSRHASDVVLIVAHTSTIPVIVKALSGATTTIADDDYTSLFVVSPGASGAGSVVRLRY